MIRKRIIGVVTVKDGWAVQSFGYRRYLPLGRPEILVENLDRWGADEILLQCIDRSARALGPDFALLERLGRRGLSTPLIYAGGIRSADDAVAVVATAADRVAVDALLHDDLDAVAAAGARLGNQAIVGALPLHSDAGAIRWHDYRTAADTPLPDALVDAFVSGVISEALVVDWRHEGENDGFDNALLDALPPPVPLIAFGGLSGTDQIARVMRTERVVAAAVGNFLAYGEHAIQRRKAALAGLPLRPAEYQEPVHG